nr:PREDICTED: 11S globulin seed storage protein 2-like [Bemisia tabaci]
MQLTISTLFLILICNFRSVQLETVSLGNETVTESSPLDKNQTNQREMDIDLSPQLCKKLYGNNGGSYYAWSPSELPMLQRGNIGAAKIALEKNGFALPSYSDSSKIAYVLQGSGVAGIVEPESAEKVLGIKTGDALAVPFGVVTWWYNNGDTELVILFLGDTSKAHKAGEFTNFQLTGSNGVFTGFSSEFVGRAWDLEEGVVKTLVGNQSGQGIVKLQPNASLPEPNPEHRKGMALNCLEAPLDVDIKGGGRVVVLNTKNLPLVGEVGLGADLVRLDGNAMCSPGFSCDSALQVTYIVRGSGRVQVVGVDGKRVLETTVKAGNLFIVPRFFVVSKIADPDGMDWFSIISTPNPVFTHLAGKTSVWKALSPSVLQAAFNVDPKIEQQFRSKRTSDAIFFPPKK